MCFFVYCTRFSIIQVAVISGVGVRQYYARFGYKSQKDYQASNFREMSSVRTVVYEACSAKAVTRIGGNVLHQSFLTQRNPRPFAISNYIILVLVLKQRIRAKKSQVTKKISKVNKKSTKIETKNNIVID